MSPNPVLKLNAMKAFNGPGVVIAVILAFILLIPKPKEKHSAPGFSDVQNLFYCVIPLPVLMVLAYKRILLDPVERRVRITKGIWPIVVTKEMDFGDSAEIELNAMKMRWIAYSAVLSLSGQKKPIPILADGDEDQLRTVLDFAGKAGVRLKAKEGMQKFAPDSVRAILRQQFEKSLS